jgi:hypothetical protein
MSPLSMGAIRQCMTDECIQGLMFKPSAMWDMLHTHVDNDKLTFMHTLQCHHALHKHEHAAWWHPIRLHVSGSPTIQGYNSAC